MPRLFEQLKSKRIMLIDDDDFIRDSMGLFFEGEGCKLDVFETAEEALMELGHHSFDIILADYKLPGIDGLEFFRRINESSPNTIKILITAYGNTEILSEVKMMGIHDFIAKPFSTITIEKSLSNLIEFH